MQCNYSKAVDRPHCQSRQAVKNGRESLSVGVLLQQYRCNDCGKQFNERIGTEQDSQYVTAIDQLRGAIAARASTQARR